MPIELLPGLTNVVRFPLERRVAPSMELVFAIAPACCMDLESGRSSPNPVWGQAVRT